MSFSKSFRNHHRVLGLELLESRRFLHGGSLAMDPVPEPPDAFGERPVEAAIRATGRLPNSFATSASGSPNV